MFCISLSRDGATAGKTRVFCDPAGQSIGRSAYEGVLAPDRSRRPRPHNSLLPSRDHTELIDSSATLQCQTKIMQRLLFAMMASAASAFAPQQLTQNSLVRLQANPIDIYSTARRGITTLRARGSGRTELLRAANRRAAGSPDIKDSDPTRT